MTKPIYTLLCLLCLGLALALTPSTLKTTKNFANECKTRTYVKGLKIVDSREKRSYEKSCTIMNYYATVLYADSVYLVEIPGHYFIDLKTNGYDKADTGKIYLTTDPKTNQKQMKYETENTPLNALACKWIITLTLFSGAFFFFQQRREC